MGYATTTAIDSIYSKVISGGLPSDRYIHQYPDEGCPDRATTCTNIQMHYMHHNLDDTIMVLN